MHSHTIIAIAAAVASKFATAQRGRSCGFKIAPCPADMYCVPDSDTCTDLNRCPGFCDFKNTYPGCGGHRPDPPMCDAAVSDCKDDPRIPDSCGMACDLPGICVRKEQPTCGAGSMKGCPQGLHCYMWPADDILVTGCDGKKETCGGVCL